MPHHHHHHKKNPVEDSIKLVQEEERTSSFSHKVATHEKQPRATATTPLAASSGAALERNFLKTLLNMNSSPQSSSSSLEISSENSESCSNSRRLEGELLDILPFHEYSRSPHLQHFIHYSVILKYIPSSSSASSPKTKHCFNPTAVLATHLQRFVHYLHRLLLHEAELTNEEDIADLLCTRILKPLVAIWCDPVFIAHCRDQVHSSVSIAIIMLMARIFKLESSKTSATTTTTTTTTSLLLRREIAPIFIPGIQHYLNTTGLDHVRKRGLVIAEYFCNLTSSSENSVLDFGLMEGGGGDDLVVTLKSIILFSGGDEFNVDDIFTYLQQQLYGVMDREQEILSSTLTSISITNNNNYNHNTTTPTSAKSRVIHAGPDSDDDDEDEEDDLQPYQLPASHQQNKGKGEEEEEQDHHDPTIHHQPPPPPRYLKQCLDYLRSSNNANNDTQAPDKIMLALAHLPALLSTFSSSSSPFSSTYSSTSPSTPLITEICETLLHLKDNFESHGFDEGRMQGIVACLCAVSTSCCNILIDAFHLGSGLSLGQRMDILRCLAMAATRLGNIGGGQEEVQSDIQIPPSPSVTLAANHHHHHRIGTETRVSSKLIQQRAASATSSSSSSTTTTTTYSKAWKMGTRRNEFGQVVVTCFFAPLIGGFELPSNPYSLCRDDSTLLLLESFVKTLGTILLAAMNTPQTRAMAREYFDLIWSLRFISPSITISTTSNNPLSLGLDHKEEFHSPFYIYSAKQANPVTLSSTLMPTPPNLTKSLLFGIAVILEVLPQSILLDEFGSSSSNSVVRGYVDLKDIQSWTFGVFEDSENMEVKRLAGHCLAGIQRIMEDVLQKFSRIE